ncbi:hypothetical protein [Agathobaculum sp.]|uniref:hypothetical protein n=1 Tax=Agathobaculum sp. TaxID=2048138 RepID=UPI002A818322|nr:hypothetical protein [Agathobaculum sp.]MDY3617975.1 hypothetical protein [Agathobaculum sp.]
MTKRVFVINGSGGVGKDTVCSLAARHWRVCNVSSITPILSVARAAGWDGQKSPAARRLLSRLKEVCTEYNDLPFQYCWERYQQFLSSGDELLFVHIREPEEISRFCKAVGPACAALLVRRPAMEQARGPLGNRSDDGVSQYAYDYIFENDGPMEELPQKVERFFSSLMRE